MAKESGIPKPNFLPKVLAVREALRQKSEEILQSYLDTIMEAREAGEYDAALKANQWLLDHMPAGEQGERILDPSLDKVKEAPAKAQTGPKIQMIGITLGQKALPPIEEAEIIEVEGKESE